MNKKLLAMAIATAVSIPAATLPMSAQAGTKVYGRIQAEYNGEDAGG
jgi:hypothetical protein